MPELVESNKGTDNELTKSQKQAIRALKIGEFCHIDGQLVVRTSEPTEVQPMYSYKLVDSLNVLKEIENGTLTACSLKSLEGVFRRLTKGARVLSVIPAESSNTGNVLVIGETYTLMVRP